MSSAHTELNERTFVTQASCHHQGRHVVGAHGHLDRRGLGCRQRMGFKEKTYGKAPSLIDKSTINGHIFNSYVIIVYQRV